MALAMPSAAICWRLQTRAHCTYQ